MQYGQRVKRPPNPGGYTSIWIDETTDDNIIKFHCHKCGTCVFQYGGNVSMMIPDYHKTRLPIIKMCPNRYCRTKYVIHIALRKVL